MEHLSVSAVLSWADTNKQWLIPGGGISVFTLLVKVFFSNKKIDEKRRSSTKPEYRQSVHEATAAQDASAHVANNESAPSIIAPQPQSITQSAKASRGGYAVNATNSSVKISGSD